MAFSFDKSKTALLVMDYQNSIVKMVPAQSGAALQKASLALEVARKAGLKVIYVMLGFREGYPEVSPNNKNFSTLRANGRFAAGSLGAQLHQAVAAMPGDLLVTKHRVSAFSGSDLEMLLRAGGIETLVLCGISSSGVVLSTLRQAADLDFRLAVLKDACLDADPDIQACLMDKIFPKQAEVMEVASFVAALEGGRS